MWFCVAHPSSKSDLITQRWWQTQPCFQKNTESSDTMTRATKVDRKLKKLQKFEVFHWNICLSGLSLYKAIMLGVTYSSAGGVYISIRVSTWPVLGHREKKWFCKTRVWDWALSQQTFKTSDNSGLCIWDLISYCMLTFLPSSPHGLMKNFPFLPISSGPSWLTCCSVCSSILFFVKVLLVYH